LEGSLLVVVHKGAVLQPLLSFQYYKIETGDRLFCLLKKVGTDDTSQPSNESRDIDRFADQTVSCSRSPDAPLQREEARLADLSFSNWEAMPDFPGLMNDLLDEEEEETSDPLPEDEFSETVVPDGAEMGSDPLSRRLLAPLLAIRGHVMTESELDYGCFLDISEQPRPGDSFDDLEE
jgi:hypothetical protein